MSTDYFLRPHHGPALLDTTKALLFVQCCYCRRQSTKAPPPTTSFASQTNLSYSTKLLKNPLARQARNPKRDELDVNRTATHTSWRSRSQQSSMFLDNKYLAYTQPHNSRFATLTCRLLAASFWWKFFSAWSTLLSSFLRFPFILFNCFIHAYRNDCEISEVNQNIPFSAIRLFIHRMENGPPSRICSRSSFWKMTSSTSKTFCRTPCPTQLRSC